jgi:hypothetical protein
MKIEYLNASGGVDSVVESPISGCFMFYNTPTADADPVYLVTHGITVKGVEIHGAHYYQMRDKQLYMEDYNGVQFRIYNISHKSRNKETWEYEGPLLGLHTNNDPNMQVREHIELKRDKWQDDQ